jgi:beta-galactosidase
VTKKGARRAGRGLSTSTENAMRIPKPLFAVFAACAVGLFGCGSSESANPGSTGGASNAGGAGGGPVAGSGGAPVAGTGGAPVAGTGGAPVAGTGGAPVAGTGGAPVAGSGGTVAFDGGAGTGGYPNADASPPPANPGNRLTYNFNYGWKFIKQDVPAASAAAFDDSSWTDVSLPHTFNDVDNFGVQWVGVRKLYNGKSWYRKHFNIDAADAGRKVFVEFQSMRNMGTVYVNGTNLGFHQDEVSAAGFDISSAVKTGDNVIAVQIDANDLIADRQLTPPADGGAGPTYDWSTQVFYPKYGGLPADAVLYIMDTIHQTLPLWYNLGTQGPYVYADPSTIDTAAKTATLTVESEVQNETNAALDVTLNIELFDRDGKSVATAAAPAQNVAAGAKQIIKAEKALTGVHLWSPDYPYLYTVRSTISVGGKPGDSVDIPFGIRKLSFNATNGFKINGHSTWLAGFAPRTIMDWAASGIPQDWMNELDYLLMKGMNHNFIRPMHVAPVPHMVTSADRLGIIMVAPAGNGEGCTDMTRWPQHVALMQAVMIYFRNNPSVAFYEGCNQTLTQEQMVDIVNLRKQWDPYGSRFAGTRGTDSQVTAMEYQSPMDNIAVSSVRPCWSAEYARQESPRRAWDAYTPIYDPETNQMVATGGYSEVANQGPISTYPTCDFRLDSLEDLSLCFAWRYWEQYARSNFILPEAQRTSQGIMIGGAKIIFNDSSTDGRLQNTEVARVGGVVDGVRIIKDPYYVLKVMASSVPDIHILGHWNYAAGTIKKVYVAANTEAVKLAVYDAAGNLVKDYGDGAVDMQQGANKPNQHIFAFPNVAFAPGKIKAVGLNGGTEVVTDEHVTTGDPAALKLTPIYGPEGWYADGADIALVEIEVVDAQGRRVPTETSDITFTHSGEGTWLGGYNSGMAQAAYPDQGIFKDKVRTDAGVNRVLVRSSRTAGTFTITVSRAGLPDATITLTSKAFAADNLATSWPQHYNPPLPAEPAAVPDN